MPDKRQTYNSGYESHLAASAAGDDGSDTRDFETLLRELQQVVDDLDGTSPDPQCRLLRHREQR